MRITVLYFAAARERAATDREELQLQAPLDVARLIEELVRRHPELKPLTRHLRVAVNQEFVDASADVPDGAEVALIPPVAGGTSGVFRISREPLSLDEVVRAVSGTRSGGVVTFTGAVRDETKGRRVVRLEYEAYAPM